jgi:hypothetical protein
MELEVQHEKATCSFAVKEDASDDGSDKQHEFNVLMQSPITKDQATTPRSHSGACKRNGESFYQLGGFTIIWNRCVLNCCWIDSRLRSY